MISLILLVIQGLLLGNIFSFLYTEINISAHSVDVDESTETSQSVQSKDPLSFSTASSDHSFIVRVNRFPLHQRPISGDKLNNVMVRSSLRRERHRGIGIFNICVALVKYTIFLCSTFYVLKIVHD